MINYLENSIKLQKTEYLALCSQAAHTLLLKALIKWILHDRGFVNTDTSSLSKQDKCFAKSILPISPLFLRSFGAESQLSSPNKDNKEVIK